MPGNLFQNPRPDLLCGESSEDDLLPARLLAAMEDHLLPGNLEKRSKKDNEGLIGGIINGWGGQGKLNGLIMNTDQTGAGGPGLDIDGKQ